jgi:NAD(P)-dependent dehydrogenase (short-subunit alcohol dehydrogenase family)
MCDLTRRDDLDAAADRRNVALRVVRLDVTDQASIEQAVRTIVAESRGIYGVVHNEGMLLRGYFEDLLDQEVRQLFETNLFGTMAVTRAVLPHMRAARRGRIIIITSVAGRIGAPSGSVYSASKFALEGFGESLMQEVTPLGLRVSMVEPGITEAESWTVDRAAGARARDPNSPYYAWFQQAEKLFERAMQSAPHSSSDVAATTYRALTDARPRLRYVVGRRARLALAARRYTPSELFERLYFGEVVRRITCAE